MRVIDKTSKCVSYRLNLLGIAVWRDRCQLLARNEKGNWKPLGASRDLPIQLPDQMDVAQFDALLLTAYQYDQQNPGSDLRDLFAQTKSIDEALSEAEISGSGDRN